MSIKTNTDDELSFAEALGEELADVKPITASNNVSAELRAQQRNSELLAKALKRAAIDSVDAEDNNPLSLSLRAAVAPDDMLSFKQPGIQEGVYKNLRLGKYAIDGVIDLQRLNMRDSRTTLYAELIRYHEQGTRAVLVKHGKGVNSQPIPALTKSFVNQWLMELDVVIAFHSAQRQHGSLGACYVLLKKHPNQKQINRERLFKRG